MNTKKAMTLAEVIFVFVIIGIIASIAIISVKPWDKACKYSYSRMFHSLRLAIYNAMLTRSDFPATSTEFCNALAEYINTSTNGVNCDVNRDLTNNPRIFPDEKIQINASNAARIWIGSCSAASNSGSLKCEGKGKPFQHIETETSGASTTTKYYIAYVDLNGNKGPNMAKWEKKRLSDIVAFIITDSLAVIPLGHPEVDTRYLYAHVVYPQVDENEPDGNVSDEMTYYEAKRLAWGNSVDSADHMSLNFYTDFPNDSFFKLSKTDNSGSVYYPDGDTFSDFFATAPSVDMDNGCSETSTPCYVDIHEYH